MEARYRKLLSHTYCYYYEQLTQSILCPENLNVEIQKYLLQKNIS